MKVLGDHAPPLATVVPSIPAEVALVVDRALAYDRANRYPDATTMKADVDALIRSERPPFASAAPPLPVVAPSSSLFSSPSPAPPPGVPKAPPPNADLPTVVPQKAAAASPPAPDAAPTRVEHVSPANVPGAIPTVVSGAPSPPSSSKNPIATPYRLSPASPVSAPRPGAPAPPPSPFVMIGIGAGAVLALLTVIAIVFFLARAAR
jgi:serine/threonine-protein kinase